jgi:hypothetical protein
MYQHILTDPKCSMSSNIHEEEQQQNPIMIPESPQSNKRLKRLSTQTTSNIVTSVPRGRRPKGTQETDVASSFRSNGKRTKNQHKIEEAIKNEQTVVCFGNRVVTKDTDEYYKKREENNGAVKRWRESQEIKQRERDERLKFLDAESKKLTRDVETLNKQLNEFKNTILQTNPAQTITEEIKNLFKQLDEDSN